ncbi:GDSL-type esterase/lipase family protein [Kitasatospora sp. NPDC051853]|uniref:GDSL-type esterase/lipase family protein n=1 Tax=Kitasatospora sp. NPDC051853 TaxID=3364058 RepID=UPI003797EAD5
MPRLTALATATVLSAVVGCTAIVPATSSAAASLSPAATSALAANAPVVRVLSLGDSITFGRGSCTGNGYRGPLQDLATAGGRYAIDFVGSQLNGVMNDPANEGHPGYTVRQIRDGVSSGWLSAARPDVVLLHAGINDLNQYADGTTTANEAVALVNQIFATQPGVTVIMQGLITSTTGMNNPMPADLAAKIDTFNRRLADEESAQQLAGRHFRFVAAPDLGQSRMNDGLHPNDAGYAAFAQGFFTPLDQAYSAHWFSGGNTQLPRPEDTVRLVNLKDGRLRNAEGNFSAGQWSSWSDMGADSITEVTSAATFSVNRVFAIRDGRIHEKDGNYATGQWTGWFEPAFANQLPVRPVSVSASALNHSLHLVVIGEDGHLYNVDADYEGGRWTTWTDHGGNFKRVASATTTDNVNHIFAVDAATNQVVEKDGDYCAGKWSSWTVSGASPFTAQDVAASASGRTVHVSAVAPNGTWARTDGDFAAGQWNGWTPMPGSGISRITSATANNVEHVFATSGGRLKELDINHTTGTWNSWGEPAGGADSKSATAAFTR